MPVAHDRFHDQQAPDCAIATATTELLGRRSVDEYSVAKRVAHSMEA
jgi:hypothetical protein